MRDKQSGDLVSFDILDIDMALSVEQDIINKYFVSLNEKYRSDDLFSTKSEAEEHLKLISSMRNQIENELRAYI